MNSNINIFNQDYCREYAMYLDIRDISNCSKVNKELNKCFNDDSVWKVVAKRINYQPAEGNIKEQIKAIVLNNNLVPNFSCLNKSIFDFLRHVINNSHDSYPEFSDYRCSLNHNLQEYIQIATQVVKDELHIAPPTDSGKDEVAKSSMESKRREKTNCDFKKEANKKEAKEIDSVKYIDKEADYVLRINGLLFHLHVNLHYSDSLNSLNEDEVPLYRGERFNAPRHEYIEYCNNLFKMDNRILQIIDIFKNTVSNQN